jgi:hypothetical protein
MKEDTRPNWSHYFLIGGFALAAGMMIALIVASFLVPPVVDRWVEAYTAAEPMSPNLPPVEVEVRKAVEERVDQFLSVERDDELVAPDSRELVLSEAELRSLVEHGEKDGIRSGMEVRIERNTLRIAVSVPIDENIAIGPWAARTRGRYLNGYARFSVVFRNGELDVRLLSFETPEGEHFPNWAVTALQRELDRERFWESDDVRDVLDELSAVELQDGEIVLRRK